MIEELTKLIKTATRTFELANMAFEKDLGKGQPELPIPANEAAAPAKPARAPKKEKAAEAAPKENPAAGVFDIDKQPTAPVAVKTPEALDGAIVAEKETEKQLERVASIFIKRLNDRKEAGLDRAKAVIREELGEIKKFPELTHPERLRLIPRFERELEAMTAAAAR